MCQRVQDVLRRPLARPGLGYALPQRRQLAAHGGVAAGVLQPINHMTCHRLGRLDEATMAKIRGGLRFVFDL